LALDRQGASEDDPVLHELRAAAGAGELTTVLVVALERLGHFLAACCCSSTS
jgi:hypothetical protein